jgi:hypothetical protein
MPLFPNCSSLSGTAERQLENVVQSTLRQLIPIRNFPRCMIQVTLQVVETPEDAYANTKLNQSHLVITSTQSILSPLARAAGVILPGPQLYADESRHTRTFTSSRHCYTLLF